VVTVCLLFNPKSSDPIPGLKPGPIDLTCEQTVPLWRVNPTRADMHRSTPTYPRGARILAPYVVLASLLVGCGLPASGVVPLSEGDDTATTEDVETGGAGTDNDGAGLGDGCNSDAECASASGILPNCIVAICDLVTRLCVEGEAPGGTTCDDGNKCTAGDVCLTGECLPGATQDCSDGVPCTDDVCEPTTGCTNPFNEAICDDGDACTDTDTCFGGVCISGETTTCDDANPCTEDDCDTLSGCVFLPEPGKSCDDSDACTVDGQCSATGVCLPQSNLECNDENPCTDDVCSALQGCTFTANEATCDDDEPCTKEDTCVQGLCTGEDDSCDDNDVCTIDSCLSGEGCEHTPFQGPCDDADPCTKDDSCVDGLCQGIDDTCDDDNGCTLDLCHPFNGCQSTALLGTQCDDGDACTLLDICNDLAACQPGDPPNCDDDTPCTTDSCDATQGCLNVPVVASCSDGDACTESDECIDGACVGIEVYCEDSNLCTTDNCIQDVGCVFASNTLNCDDGDPCSLNDTCVSGTCLGLTDSCDDDNPCTTETCGEDANCLYTVIISGTCDDTDACTVGDSCIDAECVPGPVVSCEDDDPCTIDLCDTVTGCSHTTVPSCLPPTAWPLINEFDYEQSGEDEGDYVELVVVGEQTVELSYYTLELVDGTTGQTYSSVALEDGADQLHPGERLVIGPESIVGPLIGTVATLIVDGNFLENGGVDGDAIRLIRSTPAGDAVVDSVAYEHPVPGANEGDSHVGFDSEFGGGPSSFSRCADAQDTNMNSFDFVLSTPSPGLSNPCGDEDP
jgi:hypothetical protein